MSQGDSAARPYPPLIAVDTPLMQQYREIKSRHPQTILFFRMGDFYEMFEDDAKLAARELGLTLTSRNNGGAVDGQNFPTCVTDATTPIISPFPSTLLHDGSCLSERSRPGPGTATALLEIARGFRLHIME